MRRWRQVGARKTEFFFGTRIAAKGWSSACLDMPDFLPYRSPLKTVQLPADRMPLDRFDLEGILKSFPRYTGPAETDFIIDFLGTRTRSSYLDGLQGGLVEGYPLPMNFHATALEWAGALAAVCEASGEVTAVELGAGWAPWLVSVARAASLRGISRVRLLGVEGSKKHIDYAMRHFRDNGLDPREHCLLHGVAGPADGIAEFPILSEPSVDWGNWAAYPPALTGGPIARMRGRVAAALRPVRSLLRTRTTTCSERLTCYSLATLLRPYALVDLIHIDIQGHEHLVIASARKILREKVKWLVVGTHSRSIEQQLLEEMSDQGWSLEGEEACLYRQVRGKPELRRDGCQVWRNPCLPAVAEIGPALRAA